MKTLLVHGMLGSEQLQEVAALKRNSPKVLGTANLSRDCTEKDFDSRLNNLTLQTAEFENSVSKIQS